MKKPQIISVYDLPLVNNVCNQDLREIPFELPTCSIAHVSVRPGAESLLHKHNNLSEIYFVIEGRGNILHGDQSLRVLGGSYLFIPPGRPHKLRNSNLTVGLEHLVIASPPFDSKDVHLVGDDGHEPAIDSLFNYRGDPIPAQDGGVVRELLSDEEKEKAKVQLALGYLPFGKTATPHRHQRSDEVYYILEGNGYIHLDDAAIAVTEGEMIFIPAGVMHGLENQDTLRSMEVLCISSPEFQEEDFFRHGKKAILP
ncbi:cupin domain-containing protein [Candidatus Woesearchaeota archaeon]|nr:cupin domain-containing protein [Candidatus Woesearchaeota archaeon]